MDIPRSPSALRPPPSALRPPPSALRTHRPASKPPQPESGECRTMHGYGRHIDECPQRCRQSDSVEHLASSAASRATICVGRKFDL
ncbi:hypothetical protein C8Q74DRAFT_1366156 [Fomes fomentarius]|nr:hypothetical protein C8Q74DRAFT_1366156 [Fomes fomentarius]